MIKPVLRPSPEAAHAFEPTAGSAILPTPVPLRSLANNLPTATSNSRAFLPSRRHLGEIVRQFTVHWSTITGGRGIHALTLNWSPLMTPALYGVSEWISLVNISLFGVSAALYAKRWLLLSPEAGRIFDRSVVSIFFGSSLIIIMIAGCYHNQIKGHRCRGSRVASIAYRHAVIANSGRLRPQKWSHGRVVVEGRFQPIPRDLMEVRIRQACDRGLPPR
jgi:hypothetical protein